MKTKKLYNKPSIKVIEINPSDIIASSNTVALDLDFNREDEGDAE